MNDLVQRCSIIARSGLFDAAYYVKRYSDVGGGCHDPIRHYALYGSKERRQPNPLFDPDIYLENCSLSGESPECPLLHFIDTALTLQIRPHRYFDPRFYIENNPEILNNKVNPLFHFLWRGGFERRKPCREFDPDEYLRWCPEADQPYINPILHAIEYRQVEFGIPELAARTFVEREWLGKLHFRIERMIFDESLAIEGWIFHEKRKTTNIVVSIENDLGHIRKPTKDGRKRGDVYNVYTRENAKRSGFGAGDIELSANAPNRIAVHAELEGFGELSIDVARLIPSGKGWRIEREIEECPTGIEYRSDPSAFANSSNQSINRGKSFAETLAMVGPTRSVMPNLPDPVTLLVSVYGGSEYLAPFFNSLLANTHSAYSLVVVDDGNRDPAIAAYLRALAAAHDNITLLRIEPNGGYCAAMCAAIEYAPADQHVVVLNTDIVLPPNWLERLVWPIIRDPTIASTTPFTNAGTICSFPAADVDNPLFLGLAPEMIDAALAQVSPSADKVVLPTGVGFCMAHNRAVIDRLGWYDLEAFGRGYGEENDWCLRARKAGFRNVLVPNIFVYHKHGGSFASEEKSALLKKNLAVIRDRYPHYFEEVENFFRADPTKPLRTLIAFMLAARHGGGRCILMFDHALGGGSNLFRERLADSLIREGHCLVLVTWNGKDFSFKVSLICAGGTHTFKKSSLSDIVMLSRYVHFDEVVINHLVEVPNITEALTAIISLASRPRTTSRIYIHDYFFVCPSINLLNDEDRFCGLPDAAECSRCARNNPHFMIDSATMRGFSIGAWRSAMARLMAAVETVICFSREGARRLQGIYPCVVSKLVVLPHYVAHGVDAAGYAVPPQQGLRIGVIGGIHEPKGAATVLDLARAISVRGDPEITLTVIGSLSTAYDSKTLTVTGPYAAGDLRGELERHRINLVLIPSIWPETFCYVAEEAMCLGLPLAVFDIGAPAERVRLYERGTVLPQCSGDTLLKALLQFASSLGDVPPEAALADPGGVRVVRLAATTSAGPVPPGKLARPQAEGETIPTAPADGASPIVGLEDPEPAIVGFDEPRAMPHERQIPVAGLGEADTPAAALNPCEPPDSTQPAASAYPYLRVRVSRARPTA